MNEILPLKKANKGNPKAGDILAGPFQESQDHYIAGTRLTPPKVLEEVVVSIADPLPGSTTTFIQSVSI